MAFFVDFSINNDGSYANQEIFFDDISKLGLIFIPEDEGVVNQTLEVDNENIDIENDETFRQSIRDGDYFTDEITKYEWVTSDGKFSSGEMKEQNDEFVNRFVHKFPQSGVQNVTHSIWSETFVYDGYDFRFKLSTVKDVTVKSKFLKFMIDRLPNYESLKSNTFDDLLHSAARFFDRMCSDIRDIYTFTDLNAVDTDFFQYWSLTFGHLESYSRKVAADIKEETFDEYDFFERVKNGQATESEIAKFRQFLLYSSELFKTKGTEDNIERFLKFFEVTSDIKELWTENWGLEPKGLTTESFVGTTDFSENDLDLKFVNVRFIGNENEKCQFEKTVKSIIMDNYHDLDRLEYPTDVIDEDDDYVTFGIRTGPPKIIDIVREDGQPLVPLGDETYETWDVVEGDTYNNYFLKIKNGILDVGDRISINYEDSNEDLFMSSVVSNREKIKDFDTTFTFKFLDIPDIYQNINFRQPEKEVHFTFRGRKWDTDLYADFNEYYKVTVNAKRQSVSLSKVVESKTGNIISQNLNLGDIDNIVHEKAIVTQNERTGEVNFYEFEENKNYEMKVMVNGSMVSAYIRFDDVFDETERKIESDEGDIPWGESVSTEWVCLFENINLEQKEKEIRSVDKGEEELSSYPYEAILDSGFYGYGVKTSIVEFQTIQINNLDPDETLYNDFQKEINIKPTYLDWQGSDLLRYNNYPNNSQSFTNPVEVPFNYKTEEYSLNPTEVEALQYLYFDKSNLDEILSSRYTVSFDEDWLKDNFSTEEEVMRKMIVPFSDQKAWYMNEQRAWSLDFYKNYFGTSDTEYTITTPGSTGTTGTSGTGTSGTSGTGTSGTSGTEGTSITVTPPGPFTYNLHTCLGKYKTEPLDDFSDMERSNDGTGNVFTVSERIYQYMNSGLDYTFKGIFEEVIPNSTVFPDLLTDNIVLPDGSNFINRVFFPIVMENDTERKVLGVRFKNCSDIETVINRANFEFNDEVQMWGLFTFQMPNEANKFRPDTQNALINGSTDGHSAFKAYLPLGVLNKEIQNYTISTEFMHNIANSGVNWISLDGVYIRVPPARLEESGNQITLPETNPWEEKENKLYCRYFYSAELNLATNFTDFEATLDSTDLSTNYMMNLDARTLFRSVENEKGYYESSFIDDDFNDIAEQDKLDYIWEKYYWWIPKEMWRKRDFVVQDLDTLESVATGINWNKDVVDEKVFYGEKLTRDPNSLQIRLTDGDINPYTTYYAQITLRMNWSGYEENTLAREDITGNYKNRPLSSEEASRVVTVGGISEKYGNHIEAPVGECTTFLVPISWYPEDDLPSKNILAWGNYLKGSNTSEVEPTITMTPYGLHSWLMNHSNEANVFVDQETNVFLTRLEQVTSGWTIEDWNNRFLDMVTIEFVAEKIPSDKYKIMDQYGFTTEYAPNNGAFASVRYNVGADLEWDVFDDAKLIPKGKSRYYFEIPRSVKPFRDWIEKIDTLHINNYILPESLYTFKNANTIVLNDDPIFEIFNGGEFLGRYFFDIFFEGDTFETLQDDFEFERNINWVMYESTGEFEKESYFIAKRKQSEDLVLTGSDDFYSIIRVEGSNCLKVNEDKTVTIFDPRKVGQND